MRSAATENFEARPDQVARARHFAMGIASGWGFGSEDVGLVVGELASNAVIHAHSPFTVSLSHVEDHLRIEVADNDKALPSVAEILPGATSGRGLLIVEQLSRSWGVEPEDNAGKVVWAELETS